MARYECKNCSKVFNLNKYSQCPSCNTEISEELQLIDGKLHKDHVNPRSVVFSKEITSAERELIRAQNRTTHAVRSLAITFVAAPVILIALGFVIGLSIVSENTTFIILSSLAALGICVSILVTSLTELAKSKVVDYLD